MISDFRSDPSPGIHAPRDQATAARAFSGSPASPRNAPETPIRDPNKAPPKREQDKRSRPSNRLMFANPIVLNVAKPKAIPINAPTPLPLTALHNSLDI